MAGEARGKKGSEVTDESKPVMRVHPPRGTLFDLVGGPYCGYRLRITGRGAMSIETIWSVDRDPRDARYPNELDWFDDGFERIRVGGGHAGDTVYRLTPEKKYQYSPPQGV